MLDQFVEQILIFFPERIIKLNSETEQMQKSGLGHKHKELTVFKSIVLSFQQIRFSLTVMLSSTTEDACIFPTVWFFYHIMEAAKMRRNDCS